MIRINEIAFTCYPVTDMGRARDFYENVLGLKPTLVHESEDGSTAWTEYDIGAGTFSIGKWGDWLPAAGGASVAFEVDDFDAAVQTLKERGVPFKMEPFPTPVCRMAFILDPDGSAICIDKRHAA
jgi:catechol 2,3-dioxygenase-like lactoylglutathione lyase family enzyme